MNEDSEPISISVHALSNSDSLGYRGQKAIADAVVEGSDYRIVGGQMVRLLLHVFPTPAATLRSTIDADTAVDSVEVVGSLTQALIDQDFTKEGGNLFYRQIDDDQRVEINVLLTREGPSTGIRPVSVPDVGQVDSLPELRFALMTPGVVLNVEANLGQGETITYQTRIPEVEAATVLKAHSWKERRSEKDIADLHSLLEIKEAHPDIPWRLNDTKLIGFRKDTAAILRDLVGRIARKHVTFDVPHYLDRRRFAALISKHIG
ncbi:hypothetical protein BI49514_02067 [Brevibacterium iodinum ATCC 49514]|uniref:Nucleotidyl transferase AbiEii toxin, Type IV TA system n=1 Tax=Brevibacterium iodinum ATCC 49514 TaxID=1255616 RepID=A0A2H1JJV1_9MICO|nr:hypothetical protein [Brevibacterium iodinum]SMX87703.1 hypothetical protein BI49514_02067 [Brevibacterium iodinum ATCC 49514]SUW14033.1 Uncharacterised protein [Brevibacterium iodinum]